MTTRVTIGGEEEKGIKNKVRLWWSCGSTGKTKSEAEGTSTIGGGKKMGRKLPRMGYVLGIL